MTEFSSRPSSISNKHIGDSFKPKPTIQFDIPQEKINSLIREIDSLLKK